jgi:hypothetical protein
MNKYAALFLLFPIVSWANELPPAKVEPKPIKAVESHAAPAPEVKAVSKHAAPQQMAEPIKILKPAAEHAPAAEEHAAAPEVMKPITPPVTRYVSPQFSSANAAHRPVVRSQAPHAARSSRTQSTASYAMKPGLVRVLPAAQIPSSAVLPPAKGMQKSIAVLPTTVNKTNVVWGAAENEPEMAKAPELAIPVAGRKMASPKFYTETNAELRWQYYSYP